MDSQSLCMSHVLSWVLIEDFSASQLRLIMNSHRLLKMLPYSGKDLWITNQIDTRKLLIRNFPAATSIKLKK